MGKDNTKTPEQIQIGDVIPVWGKDMTVSHVKFIGSPEEGESPNRAAKITFTDGTYAFYPPGAEIRIV